MSSLAMIFLFIGAPEWIVIGVVVLVVFGGRKIPELMKGLGQGMKEFKKAKDEGSHPDITVDEETKS